MSTQTLQAPTVAGQSQEATDRVREEVRRLLTESQAFRALPRDKQVALAHDMVNIGTYLVEPEGIRGNELPTARAATAGDPYAFAQESPRRGGERDPTRFEAQAAQEGARAAGALLREVNFPAFVSGLINGVFHSIVTSSIEQMEAYARLVADVAKTLNQFRDENVSVNQGRDYLANTYPETFFLDMDSGAEDGQPRVRLRDGVDERQALSRVSALPVEGQPLTSLDDDVIEEKLVPAARTQLATSRQQLLATLVLMGINRVVVTDGRIAAKVLFDFQARDNFRYASSATRFDYDKNLRKYAGTGEYESDYQGAKRTRSRSGDDWEEDRRDASYYSKGKYTYSNEPVLKLAQVDTTNIDAALTSKAQLMGSVEVNFKSDYLPLEKMADSFQIARIQDAARPGQAQPAAAGGATQPVPSGTPAAS